MKIKKLPYTLSGLSLMVSCSGGDHKKEDSRKEENKGMTVCECQKLNDQIQKEMDALEGDQKVQDGKRYS